MKTISVSDCRIPPDIFNNVVYRGERVCVERRDGEHVYIVSQDDLDKIMGGALGAKAMLKERTVTDAIGKEIERVDYGDNPDWIKK